MDDGFLGLGLPLVMEFSWFWIFRHFQLILLARNINVLQNIIINYNKENHFWLDLQNAYMDIQQFGLAQHK